MSVTPTPAQRQALTELRALFPRATFEPTGDPGPDGVLHVQGRRGESTWSIWITSAGVRSPLPPSARECRRAS